MEIIRSSLGMSGTAGLLFFTVPRRNVGFAAAAGPENGKKFPFPDFNGEILRDGTFLYMSFLRRVNVFSMFFCVDLCLCHTVSFMLYKPGCIRWCIRQTLSVFLSETFLLL